MSGLRIGCCPGCMEIFAGATACQDHISWFSGLLTGLLYILLSLSRIFALYKGYHAPLHIYTRINSDEIQTVIRLIPGEVNLCVGKEWYRFPSSFYLPNKWMLRFIRSEFKGQLPKPYSNQPNATWIIPNDMNDMNREEPSRYFDINDCYFMVDLDVPSSSDLEIRYAQDHKNWHLVASYPFLDASRSHTLFRAFYVPFFSNSYTIYGDYVLLLNKQKFSKIVTPDYPKFIHVSSVSTQ